MHYKVKQMNNKRIKNARDLKSQLKLIEKNIRLKIFKFHQIFIISTTPEEMRRLNIHQIHHFTTFREYTVWL